MARATSTFAKEDYGQPGADEWQELRGDLVALLDQVETQVARTNDPGLPGLAERMRDLRQQVGAGNADTRHREALKSVQRAVEKFSDREPLVPPQANPRDTLEAAIQQIRTRHFATPQPMPLARPVQAAPQPQFQPQPTPRFDELAVAVDGISDRLERLEAELRTQAKGQTANVHEIAEQVGQLSHVVELLAGAVGETGQVKRLEAHIADLAKLIADEPKIDVAALNRRLDEVALTVGTLADLQKQYADRSDVSGMEARFDDVSATVGRLADLQVQFADKVNAPNGGLKEAMSAIEDGVRSIYDRVDAIERTMAMPPAELENITAELGRIAQLVKSPSQPQGLIELIDALNQRISDIEARSAEVGGLKLDMEAFRTTVVGVLEPRFAKLETQITALDGKLAKQPALEPSIAQLEAQVRQLVARMDQTGEQLTGLAKLYSTSAPTPDLEALADMVATRTTDAVRQQLPRSAAGIDEAGYVEIEKRVGKLIDAAGRQAPPAETVALKSTINEVSERLQRLETSLAKPPVAPATPAPAPTAAASAAMPPAPAPAVAPPKADAALEPKATLAPASDPIAPLLASLSFEDESVTRPQRVVVPEDLMPANPSVDAPLLDTPFADPDPVDSAFEAMRTGKPKSDPKPSLEALEREVKPVFDPSLAERPPQPKSTLDLPDEEVFVARQTEPTLDPAEASPAPNRNTFIEAHRRAARQMGAKPGVAAADSSSLIGRAFARFQASRGEDVPAAVADKPKVARPITSEKPVKAARANPAKAKPMSRPAGKIASTFAFLKSRRQLAGDKEPAKAWTPDASDERPLPAAPEPSVAELRPASGSDTPQNGSFLVRHRQPLLLGASVIAIACLTINLINQRMKPDGDVRPMAQAVQDVGDAALAPVPMAQQGLTLPATPGPRIVLDTLSTASIDGTQQKFVAGDTPMPPAFEAATALAGEGTALSAAVDPLALESPVKVARPPAAVGPDALLAAAADGDARAQFEVAAIYTEGRAVPEDLVAAAMWYERAAGQGFVPAQYRLGNLYENGRGVEKDLEQARLWYQRAAEGGNRMAMHNLAALYAGGGLGTQQFDAAAKWFEEAANRGMKDSQFNLGMLYARGLGVTQDLAASFKWFSLAANRGDQDAAKARDDIAASLDAATVQALMADLGAFKPATIDFAANFAPIGTWNRNFDPGETITTPKVVMGVQMALGLLGFEVGTPDGVAGAKTAEAIRAFERATGMSEHGEINPRLLAVLGSQPV